VELEEGLEKGAEGGPGKELEAKSVAVALYAHTWELEEKGDAHRNTSMI